MFSWFILSNMTSFAKCYDFSSQNYDLKLNIDFFSCKTETVAQKQNDLMLKNISNYDLIFKIAFCYSDFFFGKLQFYFDTIYIFFP